MPDKAIFEADGYLPSAFYFKVVFSTSMGMVDTSFKEVSGLSVELTTETLQEGGENRYVHQLPSQIKHQNLVLKRGIAKLNSPLVLWCKAVLEADLILPIVTLPIAIYLMDENRSPIRSWSITGAYPVKWDIEAFDSQKNEVALETIELVYNYLYRVI